MYPSVFHRLDRIPSGAYILVETKVPAGYEGTAPKLITVEEVEAVQDEIKWLHDTMGAGMIVNE